jgi:DNA polymerase zeta
MMVCPHSLVFLFLYLIEAWDLGICGVCRADPQKTITALSSRIQRIEKRLQETHSVCASCTGSANAEAIECMSLDCPWLFARKKAEDKSEFALYLHDMISGMEDLTTVDGEDDDEIQIFELD